MYLFLHFIIFSNSLVVRKHIQETSTSKVLSEYGFSKNGEIQISLFGLNITNTTVILASAAQFRQIRSDLGGSANLCLHPQNTFFFKYNFTCKLNTNSNMIKFLIRDKGVYYPIIFNCNHKSISVTAQYKNHNSYLDSRDRFIPISSVYLSVIYSVFGIVWLVNMLTHPSFDLLLPKLFGFSCCLKAVSMALMSKYWYELSQEGVSALRTVVFAELGSIISNSFLFMVHMLAAFGLSTFRSKISYCEVVAAISTPLWFFIARRFIAHSDDPLLSVIFALVGVAAVISYLGRLCRASYFTTHIYEENIQNALIKLKSKLIMIFTAEFMSTLLFVFLCMCFIICNSITNSILYISEECMIIFFLGNDIKSFYIRKEYEPSNQDQDISEEEQIDPAGIHLLEEPNSSELAFMTARQ